MERATKLLVVAWVLVALLGKLWLLRSAWPHYPIAVVVLTIAAAAFVAFDPRAIAGVLVFTCIYPALIDAVHGRYHLDFTEIWLGPLVGALLPDAIRSGWHVPRRWRGGLICWALVVIVAVPIVILREMNFYPGLTEISSGPFFTARWELHVGLVILTGILWFDWLLGDRAPDFVPWIAAPLAASAAMMSLVAVYQGLFDIGFLNDTTYGVYARASGTVFDANVCGTIAALWMGAAPLLASRLQKWRQPAAIAGIALGWAAVWMTGSRTAFVAAMLVTAFLATAAWRGRRSPGSWRAATLWKAAAVAVILVAAVITLARVGFHGNSPLERFRIILPTSSLTSYRAFLFELWNRNGYGTAAASMIRQYPLVGVGLGSFHGFAGDFTFAYNVLPDNAQNWYRHLFAELGLIGSLGWIVWTVSFVGFLFQRRPGAPPSLWVLRGVLIAFGVISLVGVPGQMPAVAITFWTLACWFVRTAGVPERGGRLGRTELAAIAVVVAAFVAGSVRVATTSLRPPIRAQHLGRLYSYGFYEAEPTADGSEQHWARQIATRTIEVQSEWMELSVGVNHFDVRERPVDARVWLDGRLVVDTHLTRTDLETVYVGIRPPERWAVIETRVNRAIRPKDLGVADDRELGLIVKWRFVPMPPAGAKVILR